MVMAKEPRIQIHVVPIRDESTEFRLRKAWELLLPEGKIINSLSKVYKEKQRKRPPIDANGK